MSRRQLHETERSLVLQEVQTEPAARSCGMEALGEPQHRTKVKLRKALGIWVSVPIYVTPDIQSRSLGIGDGGGGTLCVLTQGDLWGPILVVEGLKATTTLRCPQRSRITSYERRSRVIPAEQRR